MADSKANMLLTISSIVITLSVPHVAQPGENLIFLILIGFSLLTIMLASHAAMPTLPLFPKRLPHPDAHSPAFNPLFFGDFTRLDYGEFEEAMEEIMNDASRTYEVQVREVYTLGTYLALKKYRYLRPAYMSFVCGLVLSGMLAIATLF